MAVYFCVSIIFLISGHIVKNFRWKQIINIYEDIAFEKLIQIMAIGQSINMIVPFRCGDIIRIIILGRTYLKNGYILAAASVIVDMFIDIITVGLAFAALYWLGIHQDKVGNMAFFYCTLSVVLLLIGIIAVYKKLYVKQCVYRIATLFNETIERRLLYMVYTVFSSIKVIIQKENIIKLIFFTVSTWCLYFLSYGAFALFLQKLHYNFTLTDVFKTSFSFFGDSLLIKYFSSIEKSGYIIWFIVYFSTALIILLIYTLVWAHNNKSSLIKYRRILPQSNPAERLGFLGLYFNDDKKDYIDSYLEINSEVTVLQDYSAGSNATTILCMGNNGQMFFRKYAIGSESDKLWQQKEWLERFYDKLPLAQIINSKKTEIYAYYDMKYNNQASGFFRFIHTQPLTDSWSILKDILSVLDKQLYRPKRHPHSSGDISTYIETKIDHNIQLCQNWLKEFFQGKEPQILCINGIQYPSLSYYSDMFSLENLVDVFKDDPYTDIHGDLTVENIICYYKNSEVTWYLIDCNNGKDIYHSSHLDYAKLLQSLHGCYEFLTMVKHVQIQDTHIEFLFTSSVIYRKLYEKYHEYLITNFSQKAVKSIYYHEAVHWLRLMPYKIRKNPEQAIVFYAGMLMVLSDIGKYFENEK